MEPWNGSKTRAKMRQVPHIIASTVKQYCENTTIHGFSYCIRGGKIVRVLVVKNDINTTLDSIRHQIIWVLVVLASFLGASFFLREAIDDWMENRTGCLQLS